MKNILVISTGFYPQNVIGAIRTTKLVKFLIKSGYRVTVISPKLDESINHDPTLASSELKRVKHYKISHSKLFTKFIFSKRNKVVLKHTDKTVPESPKPTMRSNSHHMAYRVLQEIYTVIRNSDWKKQVKYFLRNHIEIRDYDVVFTSYPSLSAHLLGEYVIQNKLAEKWIADFRDLIAYESQNAKLIYSIKRKIQTRICSKAETTTCVSQGLVKKISEGLQEKDKIIYLPNGFDDSDLSTIEKTDFNLGIDCQNIFKIAYVGSLYDGLRDLSALFRSLKSLLESNKIIIDKVRIFYAGKDFNTLVKQAGKYQMQNILVDFGYVTRDVSLHIQHQSDLLIVSTWNTAKDQGLVTGKVYESFLLRKPVLAIINGTQPNSELGNLVEKAGLGFVYDTMLADRDSEEQLMDFIKGIYDSAVKGEEFHLDLNNKYIEQFSYKNITNRLIEIINEI